MNGRQLLGIEGGVDADRKVTGPCFQEASSVCLVHRWGHGEEYWRASILSYELSWRITHLLCLGQKEIKAGLTKEMIFVLNLFRC